LPDRQGFSLFIIRKHFLKTDIRENPQLFNFTCWLKNGRIGPGTEGRKYWKFHPMSSTTTRAKILEVSIRLFNQQGIQNVRLQQIADEVGISTGNLAYHFYDKKKILTDIAREIDEVFGQATGRWKEIHQLIDLDNHLSHHYYLLNTYAFYFLDIVDIKRHYPEIYKGRKGQTEQFIENLTLWLEKSEQNQLFLPPRRPGHFAEISNMIWFITAFWMSKKRLFSDEEDFELGFKKMIWQQLEPFFTPEGKMEFDIVIAPGLFY
jgi:AcrR family transcriptional regulator